MHAWAVTLAENTWMRAAIPFNVVVAIWLFSRMPHVRSPALSFGLGVLSLLAAAIPALGWRRSRQILALPAAPPAPVVAVWAPTSPARSGGPDERRERGTFLSAEQKAHLATVPPQPPDAGWYSDPLGGDGTRYWNGINWTGRTIST